jgi:DNA-binding SARP family transcriptional activator
MLHIELLGELRITVDDRSRPTPTSQKARLVLARLSETGGNLARELLAESFWESTPASARVSLSTELKNLRRCLGSSAVLMTSTRSYVGLPHCDELRIDVREFAEHFRREQFPEAVALLRGEFLQETASGGGWADERRNHYRRMAARAYERLAAEAELSGDLAGAADFARSQRDMLPDELNARKRLIRLLHEMGDLLAAETERNAIVERYASRGHSVPAEVIDLLGTTAAAPPPTSQPPLRVRNANPASSVTRKRDLDGSLDPDAHPPSHDPRDAHGLGDLMNSMQQPASPLYTGLIDLDHLLGGLPEPGLTIIAGRPGMGVTTLALTIAGNASIDLGIPTALFSIESSEAQLAQRFVGIRAGISGVELRRGRVSESRWPKILKASQALAAAPLYVDDSAQLDVRSILAKLQRIDDQGAMRLVIIDSIHGLAADGGLALDSRSIAGLLFELRQAARHLDLAMIVTMEVLGDCEMRPDKRPQLRELPGYFEIGARRDLVLLVHRDEYYFADSERVGELDVIVAQNHHGPVGQLSLAWDARVPRVLNLFTANQADL